MWAVTDYLQALMDSMNSVSRSIRADYHLTLAQAIEQLSHFSPELPIMFDDGRPSFHGKGPCREHSYRGYYSDLALDSGEDPQTVGGLLVILRHALNANYQGYKGGNFFMDGRTPLWASNYGKTGRPIMGVDKRNGFVILVTKAVSEE